MLQLHFRNFVHDDVALNGKTLAIGSAPGSEVLLPENLPGVALTISFVDGHPIATPGQGGVAWRCNGQPLTEPRRLANGDRLALEQIEILIVDPLGETVEMEAGEAHQARATDTARTPPGCGQGRQEAGQQSVDSGELFQEQSLEPTDQVWRLRCVDGTAVGLEQPLRDGTVLGREAACDIVIDSSQVSRRHARFELRGGTLWVVDLGSANGTFVNDVRIDGPAALLDGDLIRFDRAAFEIVAPLALANATAARLAPDDMRAMALAHQQRLASEPRLLVKSGALQGQHFFLAGDVVTVGRSEDNDIVLPDASISRHHASLTPTSFGWRIRDLGATNGVRVNGEQVDEALLHNRDRLRLGRVRLGYRAPPPEFATPGSGLPAPAADAPQTTWARWQPQRGKASSRGRALAWTVVGVCLALAAALWWLRDSSARPGPDAVATLRLSALWQRHLGRLGQAVLPPLLADVNADGWLDVAVTRSAGYLTLLDGEQGKRIFTVDLPGRVEGPVALADLDGDGHGDLLAATDRGAVYAVDGNAHILWHRPGDGSLGRLRGATVVNAAKGRPARVLVAGSKLGLVALDARHGTRLWDTATLGLRALPALPAQLDIDGDERREFLLADGDGNAWALGVDQGKPWVVWRQSMLGRISVAPLVVATRTGPLVLFASEEGLLTALYAGSGLLSWQRELQAPLLSQPVLWQHGNDQLVIAVAADGRLFALDSQGDLRWQRALGQALPTAPALADINADGVDEILVVDGNGQLHGLTAVDGEPVLSRQLLQRETALTGIALGDLNRDGQLDLVLSGGDGSLTALSLNRQVAAGAVIWPPATPR